MSPQHPQLLPGRSSSQSFPVGSGFSAAQELDDNGQPPSHDEQTQALHSEQRKKDKARQQQQAASGSGSNKRGAKVPHGDVFQRNSPTAKKTLRSFLLNFTDENDWTIKSEIDLRQHYLDTGIEINNTTVQEVCVMKPDMVSLNLTLCSQVTDIGLWAIARHCTCLRTLRLSECSGITNIGLRSLAMKCTGLVELDFTKCANLDDNALRVIAAGMWGLEKFILTGCSGITDSGVAEIARCCHKLRVLDVSNCAKVGEYGDKALIEVGRYCHDLESLNMFGCKHVADPGIKAIAHGCRTLKDLRLTGCRELSGAAVKALATKCTSLTNLSIANCQKVGDKDVAKLAKHCQLLTNLDISDCANITAKGLAVLAKECGELMTLNLSGCLAIDDEALYVLSTGCLGLRNLNLSNCCAITEAGLRQIAVGCTGIGYLNVSNCSNITRRLLMHLIGDLQFSDPAHLYFGYQPKPNADELRLAATMLARQMFAATELQKIIRGSAARGGVVLIRQAHVIKHLLPKLQANIRGFLRRQKFQAVVATRLQDWAASVIRAAWIGMQGRRFVSRIGGMKAKIDQRDDSCVTIQRVWRGSKGRKIMQEVRNEVARKELIAAQSRARHERAATIIQRTHRGYISRGVCTLMLAERARLRALEIIRIAAARLIQRVAHGMSGRKKIAAARAAKELAERRWRCARTIEKTERGRRDRQYANMLRQQRDWLLAQNSATLIQKTWRGYRGKYMGKVAQSLAGLRSLEQVASTRMQAAWRARTGRSIALEKKINSWEAQSRLRAVQNMQRVARGHRGRERFTVQKALRTLEHKAKPLYVKLKAQEVDLTVTEEKISHVSSVLKPLGEDTMELTKEISLIMRSKAKFWDSDRISGAPQRFNTAWLQIRLDEQLRGSKDRVEELEDQLAELQIKEREKLRHIRHLKRELVPLTTGTVESTKVERSEMLRYTVRTQRKCSTLIQKRFRGHHVRGAVWSPDLNYWVEEYDITTGQNLYINGRSQETRWKKPLAMKLNEMFSLAEQLNGGEGEMISYGGWVEMKDVKKGVAYYFNNSSNQYRWNRPGEFEDKEVETNDDWFESQTDHEVLMGSSEATGQEIGTDWAVICEEDRGELLYANKGDGELRWSLSPRSAFRKGGGGGGGGG